MHETRPVHPGLFTSEGLLGSRCETCARRHFPAVAICPWCGSDAVATVTLSTSGTLWGWTAITAAPPGYAGPVPYGLGIVELADDGLRVVTRLVESEPAVLHAGMPMTFTVVPLTEGTVTWAFQAA